MLDRLYTSFDNLVGVYDLYKVETIGDAYLCAANLVKAQPKHTQLMAEFSMAAIKAANDTLVDFDQPSLGCINIRVGTYDPSHVVWRQKGKFHLK